MWSSQILYIELYTENAISESRDRIVMRFESCRELRKMILMARSVFPSKFSEAHWWNCPLVALTYPSQILVIVIPAFVSVTDHLLKSALYMKTTPNRIWYWEMSGCHSCLGEGGRGRSLSKLGLTWDGKEERKKKHHFPHRVGWRRGCDAAEISAVLNFARKNLIWFESVVIIYAYYSYRVRSVLFWVGNYGETVHHSGLWTKMNPHGRSMYSVGLVNQLQFKRMAQQQYTKHA